MKGIFILFLLIAPSFSIHAQIVVTSVAELANAASQSYQTVTMAPCRV